MTGAQLSIQSISSPVLDGGLRRGPRELSIWLCVGDATGRLFCRLDDEEMARGRVRRVDSREELVVMGSPSFVHVLQERLSYRVVGEW